MTRPARFALALAGTAGAAIALAGCATATTSNADSAAGTGGGTTGSANLSQSPAPTADAGAVYRNGSYTATGTYHTPQSVEKVTVTLTLDRDTVTAVRVTGDPQTSETVHYQGEFVAGISQAVVGKKIEELAVTRVGGSSLTSAGFNDALAAIEAQAKG
ncbi:hypothetical protein LK09_05830 [Microbacterium mangrovi]|uniref:FMN-binding domain-containing protein n=1 Tax=Microbacterium mangrovi TaxID=1348253 RepID=A0A0B2AA45_9MICO|nr:hypothetical protein [Microbacterium mangrovi]KHK98506.1 hypothetical protein LK09_05830 [Microbacterium mangrovi]